MTVVRYEPEALDELLAAVDWYQEARPGLGGRFAARVDEMLDRIANAPRSFAVVQRVDGAVVRRALLDTFPYGIVYLRLEREVRILAVAHLHRRPNYWQARL